MQCSYDAATVIKDHKDFLYEAKNTDDDVVLGEELSLPSSSQSGVVKCVTKRIRDGIRTYEAARAAWASEWAIDS